MADDNKPIMYMRYAIGEIILVVIGILIALQINNWNEERIQKKELDGLLQSIANAVQSDIRNLNLLATARESINEKADSIFEHYIFEDINSLSEPEIEYIRMTFQNITSLIDFKPSLSAFESLNNSTFIGKIQGTDMALLLSAYYTTADKIINTEEQHNQSIINLEQDWLAKFRNNGQNIFLRPWIFNDEITSIIPRYFEILRDGTTKNILGIAYSELSFIKLYEEQILMGNKLVDMIKNSKTTFDQQTKLDFSGILYSFTEADYISILINGETPTGFDVKYSASIPYKNHFSKGNDYLVIKYPENTYDWGSPYFWVNALNGRVNEMDFSSYSKLFIEMKGETGGEEFEIMMKDKNDPADGTESRIKIALTDQWKIYEFETNKFITAEMHTINVPLGFVFAGPVGRNIHVRSVQFKK